jgi:hypothetical protein
VAEVRDNDCLKSTQVDECRRRHGYALGNSVIERIVGNGTVSASSWIACHVYASFGSNGKPAGSATAMLPYNPTGKPIPTVMSGSLQFDFMWGCCCTQMIAGRSSCPCARLPCCFEVMPNRLSRKEMFHPSSPP